MNSQILDQGFPLKAGLVKVILNRAIDEGSRVLSKTFRAGARIDLMEIKQVDIPSITADMSNLSGEYISSTVDLTGDIPMRMLLMVDRPTALLTADLYLKLEVGTTTKVDGVTIGVIQELGNILGSAISNVISGDLNLKSVPQPPHVIYDYAGAIFSSYLYPEVVKSDSKIHLVETVFTVVRYSLNAKLFLLPDSEALAKFKISWE
jgi:chemotaxis protein CheY-P-specific phosphatase CheC